MFTHQSLPNPSDINKDELKRH